MKFYIDNKDLEATYGVKVLDHTGLLSFANERPDTRVWQDKSGVEKLLTNQRFDSNEFVFFCLVKAGDQLSARQKVDDLISYMFDKGLFVLSIREDDVDPDPTKRFAVLAERSTTIVPTVHIRLQNSLYVFKLGFRDVNPNAIKYYTQITGNTVTVTYDKGRSSNIFWGDGDRGDVSNSGNYTKDDYTADGLVEIIIDVDKTDSSVNVLVADFEADVLAGEAFLDVQFTDNSTGGVAVWSWDFGDGSTSDQQNPLHTYNEAGTYTVTLVVFNTEQGQAIETKTNYITVTPGTLSISDSESLLIDNTESLNTNN